MILWPLDIHIFLPLTILLMMTIIHSANRLDFLLGPFSRSLKVLSREIWLLNIVQTSALKYGNNLGLNIPFKHQDGSLLCEGHGYR